MTPINVASHSTRTVQPCGCGCSDCKDDCCDLDCLARPNFFCGQVLTDDDLKALVDWTNAKAALQRFKTGWGVACGLEVSCWHNEKGSGVKVSEGYAVDCCGRDIVVCDPLTYEFKCEKPFDPCCKKKEEPPVTSPNYPSTTTVDSPLGCIPIAELRAFELCIGYDEKHKAGQRPIVRSGCDSLADCQATRVTETGRLYAKEIAKPCDPPTHQRPGTYERERKRRIEEVKHLSTHEDLRKWVAGRLNTFCFVESCLCDPPQQIDLAVARFYIIQDWRNHYFQCKCEPCSANVCDGDGVPLARVWVWDKRDNNCRICKVAYIDSYPPYRRLLASDCWVNSSECFDLSRYVWRDIEEVLSELRTNGLSPMNQVEHSINELFGLTEELNDRELLCVTRNDRFKIITCVDYCNRRRVVWFEREA